MDAAQMLTAQEITRQCEHMARIVEQRKAEPDPPSGSERGRHLRLADPITQPIERITEPTAPDRAGGSESGSVAADRTDDLTGCERGILAFERQWWKRSGAKERAIGELFDMSSSRYYQVLNALLEKPAALRADPMLIKRLRRVRDSRQHNRGARRFDAEPTQQGTEY